MKTILLSYMLVLFSYYSNAQTEPGLQIAIPMENGTYKYKFVDSANGVSKKDIYLKARKVIIKNLKTADNMLEMNDTSFSEINATGNFLLSDNSDGFFIYENTILNFKLTILIKDGKYKMIFDNMVISRNASYYDLQVVKHTRAEQNPLEKVIATGKVSKKKMKFNSTFSQEIKLEFDKLGRKVHDEVNGSKEDF